MNYPTDRTRAKVKSDAKAMLRSQAELREMLIRIRIENELTQLAVADSMGVSPDVIDQFESYDANPTLGTIRRYALAVGAVVKFSAYNPESHLEVGEPYGDRSLRTPPWQGADSGKNRMPKETSIFSLKAV